MSSGWKLPLTRRTWMQSLTLGAMTPRFVWGADAGGTRLFPLAAIRLSDGPFARSQATNRRYLEAHAIDRLLSGFRSRGMPTTTNVRPPRSD